MGQCYPSVEAPAHPFPILVTDPPETDRIGSLVLHTWYLWHREFLAHLISIDHTARQVKFIVYEGHGHEHDVTFSFDHLPNLKPITHTLRRVLANHPSNLVPRISGTPCSIYFNCHEGWLPARVGRVYPDVFELIIGAENKTFTQWVPLYLSSIKPREALPEKLECKICLQAEITHSFKCGHVACQACAQKLQSCHLCRQTITQRRPLYL
jgi:hypothetical protein